MVLHEASCKIHCMTTENKPTDVLGIISICMVFYFPPAGIVVGLIGASKAKEEGHSPVLSRIGWITNTVVTALSIIAVVVLLIIIFAASNSAN